MSRITVFFTLFLIALTSPAIASECRPKTVSRVPVESQKSMDTFKYKGSVYRFVYVKELGQKSKYPAIYREKGNRCWIAWADPAGDQVGLSNGVPRPVAIAFSKAGFERMIAKKGKEAVQQWISKLDSVAPEDVEALKSLGLNIHSGAKIRPWDKPEHEEEVH